MIAPNSDITLRLRFTSTDLGTFDEVINFSEEVYDCKLPRFLPSYSSLVSRFDRVLSAGWCSGYHKRLPRRRSRVQIRPDASCPVTKLRIGTASAGGTHSLKLVQCFGAEWLRVTEKEISTSGNPFGELTWPCILYLVWWYLAGKRNLLLQIWAQIVPYLQLGREWMKPRCVLFTELSLTNSSIMQVKLTSYFLGLYFNISSSQILIWIFHSCQCSWRLNT